MIKSGSIKQLISEKKDLLFEKFYYLLILILQNFDYFDDLNVTLLFRSLNSATSTYKSLDKVLLLKIINGDVNFKESEYIKLICNYLMHPSLFKVFIADMLNYFIYLQTPQENSGSIKVAGFCSIYIKFKFFLLKKFTASLNEKDIELGKRIVENINQFGGLANNTFYSNALKNELNENTIATKSNEKIEKEITKNNPKSKFNV